MPFSYYARLGVRQRRIYDASARISAVPLQRLQPARRAAAAVEIALATGDRAAVQRAATVVVAAICDDLGVPRPMVKVLSKRPQSRLGELHGLYTREEGQTPRIEVWMRTHARKQVVAFRAFLRTLLHEVLHHLDYDLFRFPDSLHTEGFYQRESSLARQILGTTNGRPGSKASERPHLPTRTVVRAEDRRVQLRFDFGDGA